MIWRDVKEETRENKGKQWKRKTSSLLTLFLKIPAQSSCKGTRVGHRERHVDPPPSCLPASLLPRLIGGMYSFKQQHPLQAMVWSETPMRVRRGRPVLHLLNSTGQTSLGGNRGWFYCISLFLSFTSRLFESFLPFLMWFRQERTSDAVHLRVCSNHLDSRRICPALCSHSLSAARYDTRAVMQATVACMWLVFGIIYLSPFLFNVLVFLNLCVAPTWWMLNT